MAEQATATVQQEPKIKPTPAPKPEGKAKVIREWERSPGGGWKRYRIRGEVDNGRGTGTRYVLAQRQADAEDEYLKTMRLDRKALATSEAPHGLRLIVAEMTD